MAFDIDLACYNAVAAISAYAPATALVKAGNFVFHTSNEFHARTKLARIPNDFPQIRLELSKGFEQQESTPKTFCMMSTGYSPASCDFGMPGRLSLLMTIIHETANLTNQTPLEVVVRKFLNTKYPTLGVVDGAGRVCVNGFGVIGSRRDEINETTGRVLRTVTRLNINITARVRATQLVS